jgi:uncharacterized protein DUF3604
MRRTLVVVAVLVVVGGVVLRGLVALQTVPVPEGVTLLVTLGLDAKEAEQWDGSVQAVGGRVLGLEGRQFSQGDQILGSDRWRCSNRRDQVAPYADIHYTEMRPGSQPAVLFQPVGLWVTVEPSARLAFETSQGKWEVAVSGVGEAPSRFLNGRAEVRRTASVEKLSTTTYEDDEPSLVAHRDGSLSVAWVAYRDRGDRVLVRTRRNGVWSAPAEVTTQPADIFRTAVAEDADGNLWVFWSERDNQQWRLRGRQRKGDKWETAVWLSDVGSSTFHRAASGGGRIFVVWQSFRDGQSDIHLRSLAGGVWSPAERVSESPANDWEPAVAASADGAAFVAWDGYDRGNYDVFFRSWRDGRLSAITSVTTSPRFEAHAAVAVDGQGRPWVAWDRGGVNWGKDTGFLVPVPLAVPLHQERDIAIAVRQGDQWLEPATPFAAMPGNAEHPALGFDGRGGLSMVFRRWTRRNARTIGSPMAWENYLTRWDGSAWSPPAPLAHSAGSIEKNPALTRDAAGDLWAAWMTDERPFATQVPVNGEVYAAKLGSGGAAPPLVPRRESPVEAIPVHLAETADVRAIRSHVLEAGGRRYRIYRGDMHRHTDVSQDFKYDGSLLEVYRYALDAAGFDYIAPTDHQTGFDQEFTWWQNQKLVDLFLVPGRFTPLFAYERSLPYPNGHRNVIFAHRGVRTLPIPEAERLGKTGAAQLYEYLRKNRGISMPHSSATAQGTDWRDNDPVVEPLIEIYQGYRTSYEYEGAPRAATTLNQTAQKSGWQPEGFWWKALAKGYKLGVQSSSDHWSTHISYACLITDDFSREGLLDAIRRRHSYGATDNIILDFRARSGGATYLMGDIFSAAAAPQIAVRVIGTGPIHQIDLIKNQRFVYTARPGTKEAGFEFTDQEFGAGESWYYVRVLQQDGQIAWSSPIWITKK